MMNLFLEKYAKTKYILICFALFLSVNIFVLPSVFKVTEVSKPLDIQFTYTPDQAYEFLASYTAEERTNYIWGELTADLVYPIVYSLLLALVIFSLYKNHRLAKLPFFILGFDYIENTGIVSLCYYFPTRMDDVARLTSFATTVKWSLVICCVCIVLIGFIRFLLNRRAKEKIKET